MNWHRSALLSRLFKPAALCGAWGLVAISAMEGAGMMGLHRQIDASNLRGRWQRADIGTAPCPVMPAGTGGAGKTRLTVR